MRVFALGGNAFFALPIVTGLQKAGLATGKLPCSRWPFHARFDGFSVRYRFGGNAARIRKSPLGFGSR
jgi:hypothetical protein